MKKEIEKVKELTGATDEQIKLHDDGYWSRAYVINKGEIVVKFPKQDNIDFKREADILNKLNSKNLPINLQKVKWIADDGRCLVLAGVKGIPLDKIVKKLNNEQKQNVGKQIGIFIKQLHNTNIEIDGTNLEKELIDYKNAYDELNNFFAKYFSEAERKALNHLMYECLPKERRVLGEKIVLTHADIFEPNIIVDENNNVSIIDFANMGYCDEAADFGIDDKVISRSVLDTYEANETLLKKVEIKYDMSILSALKSHIAKHGEDDAAKEWVPSIRKLIYKYKEII